MKIVDVDETAPSSVPAVRPVTLSGDDDTQASPGLRPDVLVGAEHQRARASIKAALFGDDREAPTIGRYRVLTRLGEGAMGVVYAAFDERLDRKIALKLLRGTWVHTPEGRERAIREARALARLSHPHVVHVYEVGEAADEVFVAMEFLVGPTLRIWLEEAPRTWQQILAVFRQAAEGLAAAHRQGVVHRDFKPVNAIFGADGRLRVVDFGLAHFEGGAEAPAVPALPAAKDGGLTQTGAVLGTPAYMAPEQFAGKRGDARSDQYSLCTALYEALYHQRPFDGDTLEDRWVAAQAGRLRPAPSGSDVPAWLFRVLARGLHPDPAARWESMDALLAALSGPARRTSRAAVAVAAGLSATMFGGMAYIYTLSSPPPPAPVADAQATEQALAAAAGSADTARLTEARAALTTDPVAALALLAGLESDDPITWRRARALAAAAEARGLPAQILHAGAAPLADVRPFAGGLIARDDLGAVWRLDPTGARQLLPPGSAEQLVVARDVPVWAAIGHGRARVFQDPGTTVRGDQPLETEFTLDGLDALPYDWTLSADGRTLAAELRLIVPGRSREIVVLWDDVLRGAKRRAISLTGEGSGQSVVMADDLSLIVISEATELRLVRRDGERSLPYNGHGLALSADHGFLIARPRDVDDQLDVFDLTRNTSRRLDANNAYPLTGADVLFTKPTKKRAMLFRESLATGDVAWRVAVKPGAGGDVLVDPASGRFAAALQEPGTWSIGQLADGRPTSFLTLPKETAPQWADGALLQRAGAGVRVYRPDAVPLQIAHDGHRCSIAPSARWAVEIDSPPENGEFRRIELATGETTRFRCPSPPKPVEIAGRQFYRMEAAVDDTGRVALAGKHGWSCWWDEAAGARETPLAADDLVALTDGFLASTETGVELWRQPDVPARTWPIAKPRDLTASSTGRHAALRTDTAVQLLDLTTGAATTLADTPGQSLQEQVAGALAWSPDGTRLAVLDKRGGALQLALWDVSGQAPREHARHALADSPGVTSNRLAFTPDGAALAFTDRDASLAVLDLATGARRSLAVPAPSLFGLAMLDDGAALAIDDEGVPLLADFSGEAVMLAPDADRGFSSDPGLRRAADGSMWTCASLGGGALAHLPAPPPADPAAVRTWIRGLAR